jgi:hypothetical protein
MICASESLLLLMVRSINGDDYVNYVSEYSVHRGLDQSHSTQMSRTQ